MKKFVENTGNSPMYVNGTMIPPGEGVVVDVPDEGAPAVDVEAVLTLADQAALLLQGNVATVVEGLAGLNADALAMMSAVEGQAKKPRGGVLTAIADAQIALADAKLVSDEL